jgi:DNA-binding MarR family transcriptional regulator
MPTLRQDLRRIRNVLNSFEYRLILSKIHHGNRPSQIADQLHISRQSLNYYMNNLTKLNLIERIGDRSGISWRLTDRGEFILKEFIRRGVNHNGNSDCNNSWHIDPRIPLR